LKPRVEVEPVDIGGVTIRFTTGFHAKYISDNRIGPGTCLEIIRSGDVIPYINQIFSSPKDVVDMPSVPYHWNESGVDIIAD
jgi:NAD-dependent DNA ligase